MPEYFKFSGGGTDGMLTLRAEDGRAVQLLALHLLPTALQLSRTDGQREQLAARIPVLVSQYHPPGRAEVPLAVRWPVDGAFGPVLGLGLFDGEPLALDPAVGRSMLVVCWFVWHAERGLREIVEPGLAGLSWSASAADVGW
jgi:hypothetical protein